MNMNPTETTRDKLDGVKGDFDAVNGGVIAAYRALTPAQRSQVRDALLNWNFAPANVGEVAINLNALFALCGLMLAVLGFLIVKVYRQ